MVLDGELVALRHDPPRLNFAALQASPKRRWAQAVEVYFMGFDVLVCDGQDVRWQPYHERREGLTGRVSTGSGRVQVVTSTSGRDAAQEWMDPAYGAVGIEGVVSKRRNATLVSKLRSRNPSPDQPQLSPAERKNRNNSEGVEVHSLCDIP